MTFSHHSAEENNTQSKLVIMTTLPSGEEKRNSLANNDFFS